MVRPRRTPRARADQELWEAAVERGLRAEWLRTDVQPTYSRHLDSIARECNRSLARAHERRELARRKAQRTRILYASATTFAVVLILFLILFLIFPH